MDTLSLYGLDQMDEIMWKHSKLGDYTIKTSFEILIPNWPTLFDWRRIWDNKAIPKVKLFNWIVCHNKIFTLKNLQKRGIEIINRSFFYVKMTLSQ